MCVSGNPGLMMLGDHAWVHTVKNLEIDILAAARNHTVIGTMVSRKGGLGLKLELENQSWEGDDV
jgi:hypothetical protein